ncbi:hypothetical protein niasHT_017365 [Heterodera trifolii]|uniref:T-box domain-containing protein n=1 Tax=Heterodera trifolii TaxID=157864 RepID=A0ABD2L4Z6_9BILA
MKRRWQSADEKRECTTAEDSRSNGICENGKGIGGEAAKALADTASTSAAELSPSQVKRAKPQQKRQKFSSIEHLLREEKRRDEERGEEGMRWKRSMDKEKEEGGGREGVGPKRRKEGEREGQSNVRDAREREEERRKKMMEEGGSGRDRKEEEEKREGERERLGPKRKRKGEEEGEGENGNEREDDEGEEEEEEEELKRKNWLRAISVPDNGSALDGLNCELENAETWVQFNKLGTEMIITKSGRRMFPVLRLRFSGTRPGHLYFVFMDVVPVERRHRFRYRYDKSQWQSAGKADKQPFGRLFLHNESPFSGEQLPLQLVTFDKAKLTNNEKSSPDPDQLLLNSMHKYRPRVHVLCVAPSADRSVQTPTFPRQFRRAADFDKLSRFPYRTFEFPETKFVAVTAYQNQLVTRKKIELNPFAKGFRDQKGDEEEEKNGDKSFLAEIGTTDEWKRKSKGTADKSDGKNATVSVRCPTTVLMKSYRSSPPVPPVLPSMPCHHPTQMHTPVPRPFPLHPPLWPPLLPPHLLSGLLFRIGANQQQMREQANSGGRQTEKGDE